MVVAQIDPGELMPMILGKLHYLYAVVDLLAGIICLVYAPVSSRLVLAGIGFLGRVGVFAVREVLLQFLGLGLGWGEDNFDLLQGLVTLVDLMFGILVVVGLALAFADVQRQLRAAGRWRPPSEEEDDRPAWQRRGEP
jgi:hypothetical protein